jgi:hypothetical protein
MSEPTIKLTLKREVKLPQTIRIPSLAAVKYGVPRDFQIRLHEFEIGKDIAEFISNHPTYKKWVEGSEVITPKAVEAANPEENTAQDKPKKPRKKAEQSSGDEPNNGTHSDLA